MVQDKTAPRPATDQRMPPKVDFQMETLQKASYAITSQLTLSCQHGDDGFMMVAEISLA